MTQEEIKAIAAQLRKPEGELGSIVGNNMEVGNKAMIDFAFAQLPLQQGDKVLEIGHGNGGHIDALLSQKPDIYYTGVEYSAHMHHTAIQTNTTAIQANRAQFILNDGLTLPFEDDTFQHVITINTIYFWDNPPVVLAELRRVLCHGGKLCICFAHKEYMQKMPFTQYGFTLYDAQQVIDLVHQNLFSMVSCDTSTDRVSNAMADDLLRTFSAVVCLKE